MTTISLSNTTNGLVALKCNGRLVDYNTRIVEIERTGAGRWEGSVVYGDKETFIIIGGRASGGAANEWFVHCPYLFGDRYVPTNSATAALKLLINA